MQWKPIESAPKDGRAFITYSPNTSWCNGMDIAGWDAEHEEWWKDGCGFEGATHWLPLPDPPTDEFITLPRMEME